ncbi:hypothetical protein BVC80_609g3 [Macleaya cordata]|uniref:Uncharacterized protein n=1 Tax=Macleaya cordata TaxID=56857 RepID=A0A200R0I1_MACCD|nr:hypothetical protein BVC80_609g3 [Macleaya cordata]
MEFDLGILATVKEEEEMEFGMKSFSTLADHDDDVPPVDRLLTQESMAFLKRGISRILSKWTILREVVAKELQLRPKARERYIYSPFVRLKSKKADEFQAEIFNWFTQSKEP